ncbi:MAG: dihydroneopterin aldolase [Actinomycetota bacterium]
MSDRIAITRLKVPTKLGVGDRERAEPQVVVLNIEIEIDMARAGRTDELDDTVDYHRAISLVADLVRDSETRLLEHLAERVAAALLELEGVTGVVVELGKEPPPVEEDVESVSVRIGRSSEKPRDRPG